MTTERRRRFVPVEDYLAGEEVAPIKHEYIGGVVYAMTGAVNRHNVIATNILGALVGRLRGQPCRAFNSDTKIRLQLPTHVRFYYPDASVICQQNPLDVAYQDHPRVIFEVLSRRTRRVDQGEKKDAYLTIPSLGVLALVEQEAPTILLHRRTERGFIEEFHEGLEAVIALPEIGISLPLSEVYEGMEPFFVEPPDPPET